jgi:hypothetical protein
VTDRSQARRNIKTGLVFAVIAAGLFGLSFAFASFYIS